MQDGRHLSVTGCDSSGKLCYESPECIVLVPFSGEHGHGGVESLDEHRATTKLETPFCLSSETFVAETPFLLNDVGVEGLQR